MARLGSALCGTLLSLGVFACGSTSDDGGSKPGTGGSGGSGTGATSGSGGAAGGGGSNVGGAAGAGGASGSGGAAGSGGVAGTGGSGTGGSGTGGSGTGGSGGGTSGPHTIGGAVVGLFGTGLKLQNNGADEIAVAKSGPFTFPTQVNTGNPYAVSVSAQPTNPAQSCTVQNGSGTVGTADVTNVAVSCELVDSDKDGVPDVADPFPNDATKPKIAMANVVYPHTSSKLFTMDVTSYAITEIGNFKGSGYSGSMTDLAVDQWGVLYGVTFNDLYTCDADTATCYPLATLPQSFNGLTMLPPGTHHPYLDTLVAIANSGAWYKVTLSGSGTAQLTSLGSYGTGYSSSGDAFSIEGVGTYGSVDKTGVASDVIVSVDPLTGKVTGEVGTVTGYSSLYGLAGWQGKVFGFDASGAVLEIDIKTGATTLLKTTGNSWWGAGVATRL
ncbi:MAG: hypothetical protein IPM35_40365 [Myxococcales bacterium]|nr:hypothetical protein [Myxococcales bacterium]